MSDTAYVRILVASPDAVVITKAYGTPDEEDDGPQGHTMVYYSASTDAGSILCDEIGRGVPFEGEHGATIEHPEHGFCAAEGRYLEWPLLYGQPCVSLKEGAQGRLVIDRANLERAREYWALRRRAMQCVQGRRKDGEAP
ncbi:MAG: hypothetical protein KJ060_19320 [Candidatus Hydrogenedentes bacterium]|nr:hypothetical protein [Candidatus Hydrogenedentota bacterium]